MTASHPKAAQADIALVLEGTFPYVSGGVSSWINQILRAYPQYRFALVFLGSRRSDYGAFRYQLPDNVVHFEEHYLYEHLNADFQPAPRKGHAHAFDQVEQLIATMERTGADSPQTMALFQQVVRAMQPGGSMHLEDFLYSERAWNLLCDVYRKHCTDPSFVDYFWTVRIMFQPLWLLARVAQSLIPVRAVHCASTGYAGFLGALLEQTRGTPLILSEHGIYTKERKIDLAQASWIAENPDEQLSTGLDAEVSYIRRLWIRFFERVGLLTYRAANPIVALYEGNRQRQVLDGAEPRRTRVIPNGIDLDAWAGALERRPPGIPPVVGLVGRVVPIKDVKTFIRAMRGVVSAMPEAEGWIVGPEEEDPDYASECRSLVASLGLQDKVKFLGFRRIGEVLPQLGLMVLTSISEAQPLVILEAWAAGAPVVSSDVGSCRELIEGADAEDRALGRAGEVVAIADPQATSRAILALLRNPQRWQAAQAVGLQRVERYYTEALMLGRYRGLYREATEIA